MYENIVIEKGLDFPKNICQSVHFFFHNIKPDPMPFFLKAVPNPVGLPDPIDTLMNMNLDKSPLVLIFEDFIIV